MRTTTIGDKHLPAFEVRVHNNGLRAYMQTQVLAGKAQPHGFRDSLEAFRSHFFQRRQVAGQAFGRFIELDNQDAETPPEYKSAVQSLFDQLGYTAQEAKRLFDDYNWKIAQLPDGIHRILSIGCGGGAELIFLRARFPKAKITALDYRKYLHGGDNLLRLVEVEFIEGDIFENIKSLARDYDLIFSNHVIEHFYEPDEQIMAVAKLLREGGIFSAGLPLDAYPLSDMLIKVAKAPERIHPLDLNWLDVRHPWKTNESDLAATLLRCGLDNVRIYQRINHVSRSLPISIGECQEQERRAKMLYSVTLAPVIGAIKAAFGERTPRSIARLLFAVDRRLWFGRYRLKCDVQPEVFAIAERSLLEHFQDARRR